MGVVSVALRSGPASAEASVAAASEALRSAASEGARLAEAASVASGSPAPASAAQFAWPASVVVAFVGAGAAGAGVYRSQVSDWAWATTAILTTLRTTRTPAWFGTGMIGSTPATEMARYELRLDRTRRFTPAGFALGPSYSGLGGTSGGLKRSTPQSEPIAGSRGERQYRAIIATAGLASPVRFTQAVLNGVILRAAVPRFEPRIWRRVSRLVSAATEIKPQRWSANGWPVVPPPVAVVVLRHTASPIVIHATSAAVRCFGDR